MRTTPGSALSLHGLLPTQLKTFLPSESPGASLKVPVPGLSPDTAMGICVLFSLPD